MTDTTNAHGKPVKSAQSKFRGEIAEDGMMTCTRMYTSSSAPTVNHDGYDSAGIKQLFEVGDLWQYTTYGITFKCTANTAKAAVWEVFTNSYSVLDVTSASQTASPAYNFYSVSYTVTGAVTIALPSAADSIGKDYVVADSGANASANNITISRAGTDTIVSDSLAQTNIIINSDGVVIRLIAINSSTWKVY